MTNPPSGSCWPRCSRRFRNKRRPRPWSSKSWPSRPLGAADRLRQAQRIATIRSWSPVGPCLGLVGYHGDQPGRLDSRQPRCRRGRAQADSGVCYHRAADRHGAARRRPGGGWACRAPIAVNSSNVAVLTPPAVSQGAVAYGATVGSLFGAATGRHGHAGAQIRQPEPRLVTFTFRNVEVLARPAEIDRTRTLVTIFSPGEPGSATSSIPTPSRHAGSPSLDPFGRAGAAGRRPGTAPASSSRRGLVRGR